MKRLLLRLAFAFCIILAFNIMAFAYTPAADKVGVFDAGANTYDYKSYNIVSLTNKGADVPTDMPAVIMDGRTMVPVRVISEGLGAGVLWLSQTRQVSISYGDLFIVLTIDSAEALVNGKSTALPEGVPAVLAKYNGVQRTLVPLRFVAEQLGADVEWDPETYTVHVDKPPEEVPFYEVEALNQDAEADMFAISTGEPADYDVKFFDQRLVIDIFNAKLSDRFSVPNFESAWAEEVRYSQYTGYADIKNVVRIVFQMKSGARYPENVSVDASADGISVAGGAPDETVPGGDAAGFTVVIDAGHGGDDPGAMSGNYRETDINLAVALRVRDLLQNAGVKILMTRTDDTYVSLAGRAEFANANEADIFVSIHTNASSENFSASGIETYYLAPGGWAVVLANCIQDSVIDQTGAFDRGAKTANFFVLRETDMPAALIETGFITTESDRVKLFDEGYRDSLAEGIATGILEFLDKTVS